MMRDREFYTRLLATAVAILAIMGAAKVWFFSGDLKREASVSAPRSLPAGKVVSWEDADKYYGQSAIVEGEIVAAHNSGKACFLNFHRDYKRYFTAVIFASAFNSFPPAPETYYLNKRVRVKGYIKEYQGKPEIIVSHPDQIEIIE